MELLKNCKNKRRENRGHTVIRRRRKSKARTVIVTKKTSVEDHVARRWKACEAKQKAPKVEPLPFHPSLARRWEMTLVA
jgi:hypothetical protein